MREQQAIAHAVESGAHGRKPFSHGSKDRHQAVLAGELVIRGQAEPPSPQGVVIGDVRSAFAQVARRDIVGKQAGEPEGMIPQVGHHPEASFADTRLQIRQDIDQVPVTLVVVPVDAPGAVPLPEFQKQGRQIVGKIPVIDARASERLPRQHVEKERLGGHQHRPHGQQALQQIGSVQQRVGAFRRQPPFEVGPAMRGASAQ